MSLYITKDVLLALANGKNPGLTPEDEAMLGPILFNAGVIKVDAKWGQPINNITRSGMCNSCLDSGWEAYTCMDAANGNLLILEMSHRCEACVGPESRAAIKALLPTLYQWVDYMKLEPVADMIPVPIAAQKQIIEQIRSGEQDGHSVLFCGPTRTGKSVLISALLGRMVHKYICAGFFDKWPGYRLPIYRINADEWVEQHEEWKLYKFASDTPRPPRPEVNPASITRLMWPKGYKISKETLSMAEWKGIDVAELYVLPESPKQFPTVLILEEVDKFGTTDFKLRALEGLLNAVFEQGGMIV